jgi:hypothetical protein
VLAHILNWGDSTFVGQERFSVLLNKRTDAFVPGLFDMPRLARFEAGDCLYPSYGAKDEYFAWYAATKAFDRLDGMARIGDKIPNLYAYFDAFKAPAWEGCDVTVLHIVRNALDVAASFQSRKENPADGWDADYLAAIPAWSNSVICAHALIDRPDSNVRMGIVDYDAIFEGDLPALLEAVHRIYGFIGEDFGPRQEEGMQRIYRSCQQLKKNRQPQDKIRDDVRERIPSRILDMHRALSGRSITANAATTVE